MAEPSRVECSHCRKRVRLNQKGMVYMHASCPGGGTPPLKLSWWDEHWADVVYGLGLGVMFALGLITGVAL